MVSFFDTFLTFELEDGHQFVRLFNLFNTVVQSKIPQNQLAKKPFISNVNLSWLDIGLMSVQQYNYFESYYFECLLFKCLQD